jgi:hypothetical protein
LGYTTNHRAFHLDISYTCWLRVIWVLFCVSRVSIAEEAEAARDKLSGDTITVDVQTLLEAF